MTANECFFYGYCLGSITVGVVMVVLKWSEK